MKITHKYDPWHYLEVEDFLPQDEFENIKRLAMIEYEEFKKVGGNAVYTEHKDYVLRNKYTRYLSEDIVPTTNQFFEMHS